MKSFFYKKKIKKNEKFNNRLQYRMSNFYIHTSKNLEILENNTEFINLLNKIGDSYRIPVNNDYFDSYEYFIHKIKSALDDVCFDKTIEYHNDTIKARIFYDMPENIIWLERSYRRGQSSIDDFVKLVSSQSRYIPNSKYENTSANHPLP